MEARDGLPAQSSGGSPSPGPEPPLELAGPHSVLGPASRLLGCSPAAGAVAAEAK